MLNKQADEQGPAIDLFPSRIRDVLVEAKAAKNGQGSFDPAKAQALVPTQLDAWGRTLRLHEALHAIYSGKQPPATIVEQAAEDIRLHLNHAALSGFARRDEITTALLDLRLIPNDFSNDPKVADAALSVFLRALAILYDSGSKIRFSGPVSKRGRYARIVRQAYRKLNCPAKKLLGQSIKAAFKVVAERDDTVSAVKVLSQHFHNPEAEPKLGEEAGANSFHEQRQERQQQREKEEEIKLVLAEEYELKAEAGEDLLTQKEQQMLKKLIEKGMKAAHGIGDPNSGIPAFEIERLVADSHRDTDKGPQPVGSICGSRIRAKKLAVAAASPVAVRLFERKRPVKGGGTVLIDASGSMNLTMETLREIIDLMPSATVAYYCGGADNKGPGGRRSIGKLVIVAEKGKQFAGSKLPYVRDWGGNNVDYESLRWLLKQDRPRYFVTDGEFCGSSLSKLAINLFREAKARKLVTQIESLDGVRELKIQPKI